MPFARKADVAELLDLLGEFERCDQAIAAAVAAREEVDSQIAYRALAARFQIRAWLFGLATPVRLPPGVSARVRAIRNDSRFAVDSLAPSAKEAVVKEWLENTGTTGGVLDDIWAAQELTEELGGNPMVGRAYRCGGLVLTSGVPPGLYRHAQTVKDCFAVGLFDAVVVFCRGLVEALAFEAARRRGYSPRGAKVTNVDEVTLVWCLRTLAQDVPTKVLDGVHQVRLRANQILHSKQEAAQTGEEDAFEAILHTFHFVEHLYGG